MVVDLCVREGPDAVRWLAELGARVLARATNGELDLGREGGHSARRIVHAGDITGREIERALLDAVRASPNIRVLEWHMGVDLITLSKFGGPDQCVGAYVLDETHGAVETILARATVLATGGAGKVYLYTTNPDVATGDGVAMAFRAGAEIANMEFYQFHPTVPLPPARQELPRSARRCAARARCCALPGRRRRSWRGTIRSAISRRATSWRAPSTSR